jgi:Bifunctional DNA primase/polymerase, N-terminal
MRPNIETTKPPTRTRKPAEVSRDTSLPTPPAEDAAPAVWAQYLAEIGRLTGAVKVFLCGDNNKKPRRVGWQAEASNDPETIKAWWAKYPNANIGLAIQPGFGVLDVDLYKPGAREKLEAFEAEHGKLPATLEFCTARGGRHLVYVTSKNFGNSAGSLPDCIDHRGAGTGYIVGPGSTFEGNRYALKKLMPPIDCPPHIEAMLTEARRRDRSKSD